MASGSESEPAYFLTALEKTIDRFIHSQGLGFLLGAGTSYLNGKGYPLASELWDLIKNSMDRADREAIDQKLAEGAEGIEDALDLLDVGKPDAMPLRIRVAGATARLFRNITAPLETHTRFVRTLKSRRSFVTHVFSLNYDPLIERAADLEQVAVQDGFGGRESFFFDQNSFRLRAGYPRRSRKGPVLDVVRGTVNLYKLHGSLGWYMKGPSDIRRGAFSLELPSGSQPLMIPPQWRKAQDTGTPPYSGIWTEFRSCLINGPPCIKRLLVIGYGLMDEHVNDVLISALARHDFSIVVCSRNLTHGAFERFASNDRVTIVTESRCSMNGERASGHPCLWSFEEIVERISR